MRIVETHQTITVRPVERQAVIQPVWFGRRDRHLTHDEADPMVTVSVNDVDLPIQPKQGVEGRVALRALMIIRR